VQLVQRLPTVAHQCVRATCGYMNTSGRPHTMSDVSAFQSRTVGRGRLRSRQITLLELHSLYLMVLFFRIAA